MIIFFRKPTLVCLINIRNNIHDVALINKNLLNNQKKGRCKKRTDYATAFFEKYSIRVRFKFFDQFNYNWNMRLFKKWYFPIPPCFSKTKKLLKLRWRLLWFLKKLAYGPENCNPIFLEIKEILNKRAEHGIPCTIFQITKDNRFRN